MAFEVGDRVGDYEITGVLGAGGMGKVYKVRNVISDRQEALKILLPDLAQNNEVAERFLREIRVLASLEHPNIAALRTAQREGNQILMVMEYIEGQTLEALLFQGPIPLEWQLYVVAEVLAALDYAHGRGVVHRDIKPSNIMMTPEGHVKLMDFGIAKLAADQSLTATGAAPGSLYYMSPEQIQGASTLDGRSDIYSLGICLYQMVTGKRPFDAASQYSLMSAHLNLTPQAPIELARGVPPGLNEIVMKSLEKKPEQRFQSAAEMRQAVDAVRQALRPREATATSYVGVTGALSTPPPPAVRSAISTSTPPPGPVPQVTPSRPSRVSASSNAPAATGAVAAGPIPMPPPVARTAGKSRRGLYMALGSVATVAVLVGALLLAPRFLRTSAKTELPAQTVPTQPVQQSQPPEAAAAQPEKPAPIAPSQPAARPETSRVSQRPPVSEPSNPPPMRQQSEAPRIEPQRPPEQTAPTGPSRAEVESLREEHDQLAIRAATVTSGLHRLESQMGGLGLRADMREVAARMHHQMNEARVSIQTGDMEGARKHLDLADRAIERLEKFLGQ